jgi:Uma2 family endonuclease
LFVLREGWRRGTKPLLQRGSIQDTLFFVVAPILTRSNELLGLDDLLRPARLPNGTEPEQRIIVCGVSWRDYLKFDKLLGDDRSGPRLYYLDGDLEIMSTSEEHERIKKWVGDFIGDYLMEQDFDVTTRGQATMRKAVKKAGAEPDDAWCIGGEKKFPDLVFEVALTTGVNKLEIYRRMNVAEVWFWRRNKMEIYSLNRSYSYDQVQKSRLLPGFDFSLLERCLAMKSWREARKAFRAGLR